MSPVILSEFNLVPTLGGVSAESCSSPIHVGFLEQPHRSFEDFWRHGTVPALDAPSLINPV